MKRAAKSIVLLLSIAIACAAEQKEFRPLPAGDYAARQTIGKVTIGAKVYEADDDTKPVFGKKNPNKYGVTPILVVIENQSGQVLRLENIQFQYITGDRETIDATPADEVKFVTGPKRPSLVPGPIPGRAGVTRNKGPLTDQRIESRGFAAKMLPSGDSASGFVYFQTNFRSNSTLLISGIKEAATGKDLFFFEIPMAKASQ